MFLVQNDYGYLFAWHIAAVGPTVMLRELASGRETESASLRISVGIHSFGKIKAALPATKGSTWRNCAPGLVSDQPGFRENRASFLLNQAGLAADKDVFSLNPTVFLSNQVDLVMNQDVLA